MGQCHTSSNATLHAAPAVFYSNRAQCHLKLGQVQAAIEDWTHAHRLDSTRSKTLACLGKAFTMLGSLEDANAWYRHALHTATTAEARHVAEKGLSHIEHVKVLVDRAESTQGMTRLHMQCGPRAVEW